MPPQNKNMYIKKIIIVRRINFMSENIIAPSIVASKLENNENAIKSYKNEVDFNESKDINDKEISQIRNKNSLNRNNIDNIELDTGTPVDLTKLATTKWNGESGLIQGVTEDQK